MGASLSLLGRGGLRRRGRMRESTDIDIEFLCACSSLRRLAPRHAPLTIGQYNAYMQTHSLPVQLHPARETST
eukprot:6206715-Pleurochrysis_carterae.AAC.2